MLFIATLYYYCIRLGRMTALAVFQISALFGHKSLFRGRWGRNMFLLIFCQSAQTWAPINKLIIGIYFVLEQDFFLKLREVYNLTF